jgi:nucleoside phosphorylase
VEQGIINGGSEYAELVDMESSGIFQVCRALVPEQRLAFIKIVSDHMDLNKVEFKKNIISKLISNNMNTIDSFLKSCYFEEY